MPLSHKTQRFRVLIAALTLCAIALALLLFTQQEQPFRFIALDVGQGDALLLETPQGQQVLIDGGPSNAVLKKLGRAMPLFDRTLDLLVITHPDADHITGLIEVVRRYRIKQCAMTGVVHTTATYALLQKEMEQHNLSCAIVRTGHQFLFSNSTSLTILAPSAHWQGRTTTATNETGIVGKFVYQNFSVLLMADVSEKVERDLIASGQALHAAVLKVGHHGSRTSSSATFLDAIRPEIAVISAGAENRYGHPHPLTLERFANRHVPVHRTDQSGDILILSNGHTYTVRHGLPLRLW